jgi:hypothetical protein
VRVLTAAALAGVLAAGGLPARAEDGLRAGAAVVEVALPPGVPLAGYGGFPRRAWLPDLLDRHPQAFWFRPSGGRHDAISARALALADPGTRIVWIALDLVGVDPSLVEATRARLAAAGGPAPTLVVSASHTHSGPGAYADSALFGFVAVDRPAAAVRDALLAAMEAAARGALDRLRPARLGAGSTLVPDLTLSRLGRPLDPELGLLKVVGHDGRPIAALWNYAIHGTALPRRNLLLSGDVMGAATARLERRLGAPALFVNGAVGDVSPRHRGWDGLRASAEVLAAAAGQAWEDTPLDGASDLAVAVERVALPAPAVALRNCLGSWLPRALRLGLGEALPARAELVALRLGRSLWVTVPGELETALGLAIKAARPPGAGPVFVAGLSNDYLGYFLTPEGYGRPGYIACASLYGPAGGAALVGAARRLVGRVWATRATPPPGSGTGQRGSRRPAGSWRRRPAGRAMPSRRTAC